MSIRKYISIGALVSVALWAVLILIVALKLTHSMIFTSDSMHYVDVARTIISDGVIGTYDLTLDAQQIPQRSILWPPFYPIVLSMLLKSGAGMVWAARAVSLVCVLLSVFIGAEVCCKLSGSEVRSISRGVLLLTCGAMTIYAKALTEPLFVLLGVTILLPLVLYAQEGQLKHLVLVAVLGAFAFLTRYVAIVYFPLGLIAVGMVWWRMETMTSKRAIVHALSFTAVFSAIAALWLIRNYLLTGHLTGPARPDSEIGLFANIRASVWTLRGAMPWTVSVLLAALMMSFRGRMKNIKNIVISSFANPMMLIVWYAAGYIALVLILSCLYEIDEISERLFSPLQLPLVILCVSALHTLCVQVSPANGLAAIRRLVSTALILVLCMVYLPVSASAWRSLCPQDSELAYTPVLKWIREKADPETIFVGNDLWYHRFRTGATVLESGYPSMPALTVDSVREFLAIRGQSFDTAYLIAQKDDARDVLFSAYPVIFQTESGTTVRNITTLLQASARHVDYEKM